MEWILSVDKQLFVLLNAGISNSFFDAFFVAITESRFWIAPAVAITSVFIYYQRSRALVVIALLLVTVALADPLGARVIKPLAGRLRPCNQLALVDGGRFLLGFKGSFSFPSNHAMNMFACASLLTFFYPRKVCWFFAFACVIGFSRIYTGVHYPLDIAGGAVFGIVVAAGVAGIYHLFIQRQFLPSVPLGFNAHTTDRSRELGKDMHARASELHAHAEHAGSLQDENGFDSAGQ